MKRARFCPGILTLKIIIAFTFGLPALTAPETSHRKNSLDLPVKEYVLENGLKLLVLPRDHVPQVACRITYAAGSANEKTGETGISHLLEHMMFKGTKKIGVADPARDRRLRARLRKILSKIRKRKQQNANNINNMRRPLPDFGGRNGAPGPEITAKLKKLKEKAASKRKEQRRNLKPNELSELYRQAGGTNFNAGTSYDLTTYFVKLPSGTEELFFWLESDRMQNAVFRRFLPEKHVVLEERRQRVQDSPKGRFQERLNAVFFEALPYRRPVIGYEADIKRITREDLRQYYETYNCTNNAVVTIVGDVDPPQCVELAKKYFGRMHRGPDIPAPPLCRPEELGTKRLEAKIQAPDQVICLYHTPPEGHPDSLALDLAAGVLSGTSGRLHRRLVLEERLAVNTSAWNWTRKYAGEFGVSAQAAPGADLGKIEELLLSEVKSLYEEPPAEKELARSRVQYEAGFVRKLQTLMGTADLLSTAEVITSWRDVKTYLPRLRRITPEQAAAKAKKYLSGEKTVGVITRKREKTQ